MKYHVETVTDRNGNVVVGASVAVLNYPALTPATIYNFAGALLPSNVVSTDPNGEFAFRAPDGRYSFEISGPGLVTRRLDDILIEDPADPSAGVFNSLTLTGFTLGSMLFVGAAGAVSQDNANLFWDSVGKQLTVSGGVIAPLLTTNAATTLDLKTSGGIQHRVAHTASAVNYMQTAGAATGGNPYLASQGSDLNIGVSYATKGASGHSFYTDGFAAVTFAMSRVASSVNYLQASPQATLAAPGMAAVGADVDVGYNISTKGAGGISFQSDSYSANMLRLARVASSVNFWQFAPNATLTAPFTSMIGSDTNISSSYSTKGIGTHIFAAGSNVQARVRGDFSPTVNWFDIFGALTGIGPQFRVEGSDANIGSRMQAKGTSTVTLETGQGNRVAFAAIDVASSVNYVYAQPSATGAGPTLAPAGTDANPGIVVTSKGAGGVALYTGASARQVAFFADTASSVNLLGFTGAATANAVTLGAHASSGDANAQTMLYAKGTSPILFRTNGSGGSTQVVITHTPSAVDNWSFTGAATTDQQLYGTAQGSDANVAVVWSAKGTSGHRFLNGAITLEHLRVGNGTAGVVNHPLITGGATGNPVSIVAEGSDADVDLLLAGKGAGLPRFGTNTAKGAEAFASFIMVKDAGGTSRKLMVCV